ncbi:MAG: DUF473 family protein [Methanotrichaceae archaeon]
MDCVVLTGISRYVIKDLMANGIRTIEARSPHNFFSLLHISPGDMIFLTEASAFDIVIGTTGLLARIKNIQVVTHRRVQTGVDFYEETEAQVARAQLEMVGHGRVRYAKSFKTGSPLVLDVDEVCYYDAG